jgi:hypothetical protein
VTRQDFDALRPGQDVWRIIGAQQIHGFVGFRGQDERVLAVWYTPAGAAFFAPVHYSEVQLPTTKELKVTTSPSIVRAEKSTAY